MNKTFKAIDVWITRICKATTAIAAVCVAVMMAIVVADIIGAKVFNHPIPLGIYLIADLDVVVVFLALGFVTLSTGHMNVQIFDRVLPPGVNKATALFSLGLSSICGGFLTWFGVLLVRTHVVDAVLESSIRGFYLWPISTIMVIGLLLMTLAFVVAFVRELMQKPAADEAGPTVE